MGHYTIKQRDDVMDALALFVVDETGWVVDDYLSSEFGFINSDDAARLKYRKQQKIKRIKWMHKWLAKGAILDPAIAIDFAID